MIKLEEAKARFGAAPVATREDFVNKPAENKPEFKDLNPQAPIADKINNQLTEIQNAETVEALQSPIATPADVVPADWADRTLKVEEVDATWTDKLLKNKEYQELYRQLVNFLIGGYQKKFITDEWLNEALTKYTDKKITSFTQPKSMTEPDVRAAMNQIPPAMAKFILSTMKQAYITSKNNVAA